MTASLDDAQTVLSVAQQAGFRESGIMSLGDCPMVAIRSTGLSLDSIIAFEDSHEQIVLLVDEDYLRTLSVVANVRFSTNTERIRRFQAALTNKQSLLSKGMSTQPDTQWEDAASRRERKRREGLMLQQEIHSTLKARKDQSSSSGDDEAVMLQGVSNS